MKERIEKYNKHVMKNKSFNEDLKTRFRKND